ncbi:MAG: glycosyltransferase family 4 protein [Saprospiraceae bacterium]|nr:glycosyltransferase family 4 protein [Saprospiraceae bacterium]
MRIHAIHLLNDFSGSPKVLSQLVKGWGQAGMDVELVINRHSEGFLSGLSACRYRYHPYRFFENKALRLLMLLWSQMVLAWQLFFRLRPGDVVYINTVLPFGAAVAGRLRGCRVIWHVHETSMKPLLLKRFLFGMARRTASEAVYVSNFLANQEDLGCPRHVLYNALPADFAAEAAPISTENHRNVLMICSLKAYKGVDEFVELARRHAPYRFRLVVNASGHEIARYFEHQNLPDNVEVFPVQKDVRPFYTWADVVLNLSRPDQWVETFGLTAIEAMAFGLPLIVPPVGGIAELVDEGLNGFKRDVCRLDEVSDALKTILENEHLYTSMCTIARERAAQYSEAAFWEVGKAIVTGKMMPL